MGGVGFDAGCGSAHSSDANPDELQPALEEGGAEGVSEVGAVPPQAQANARTTIAASRATPIETLLTPKRLQTGSGGPDHLFRHIDGELARTLGVGMEPDSAKRREPRALRVREHVAAKRV
jgi:hypothetical protein